MLLLLLVHEVGLLLLVILLVVMLHHHLLLLRTIVECLSLLLRVLLLILHVLLGIVADVVIGLVLSICIEILLLRVHVLEVHELLTHHILNILEVHVLIRLHLLVGLMIKPSCLKVEVSIISLELHSSHVHRLHVLECSHVLHLHVLEILHVLINVDRLLLLHEVLRPVLLLLELVSCLLNHSRDWWLGLAVWIIYLSIYLLRNIVLLHSKSYNINRHLGLLLVLLLWLKCNLRGLDTLGNSLGYRRLFHERWWCGCRGIFNNLSFFF